MTQEDLDEARDELLGGFDDMPFEPSELVDALHGALSIRDLTATDSGTRAVVDVHPRAAIVAIGGRLEEAGEVDDYRDDFAAATDLTVDELPETIAGVATLLFDGAGHLRELTVPMLDIGRQVIALADDVPPRSTTSWRSSRAPGTTWSQHSPTWARSAPSSTSTW